MAPGPRRSRSRIPSILVAPIAHLSITLTEKKKNSSWRSPAINRHWLYFAIIDESIYLSMVDLLALHMCWCVSIKPQCKGSSQHPDWVGLPCRLSSTKNKSCTEMSCSKFYKRSLRGFQIQIGWTELCTGFVTLLFSRFGSIVGEHNKRNLLCDRSMGTDRTRSIYLL